MSSNKTIMAAKKTKSTIKKTVKEKPAVGFIENPETTPTAMKMRDVGTETLIEISGLTHPYKVELEKRITDKMQSCYNDGMFLGFILGVGIVSIMAMVVTFNVKRVVVLQR